VAQLAEPRRLTHKKTPAMLAFFYLIEPIEFKLFGSSC